MVQNKNDNNSILIINNPKNEKFREKLETMLPIISKNREERSNIFQKAVKKIKNDENYAFYHPLIERHFLFKVVEEMKEYTNDKKFILFTYKLESDLLIIYISTWVLLINKKYFKFLYDVIMTSAYLAISFLK